MLLQYLRCLINARVFIQTLIQQEHDAKLKLAKLTSLIDAATNINQQLQLNAIP